MENCDECEEEESSRWWEQLQRKYENQSTRIIILFMLI